MSLAITLHLIFVIPALVLGIFMLIQKKGTAKHKLIGWVWVVLMQINALITFFIQLNGRFSWIHILSVITIISTSIGIWAIRNNKRYLHMGCMIGPFVGMIIAGVFAAILPGRIVYNFLFGA